MNGYCRLSHLKAYMGRTTTTDDAMLVRAIDAASRFWDKETGRPLYCEQATKVFAGRGGRILLLEDDLVSATTVKVDLDRDGTYEITLTVNTDYWLYPANPGTNEPYRGIELNPTGTQISAWPEWTRAVQVVGFFGYSYETEATGLTGTVADTTGTTLTANATAAALVDVGDTIRVEDEQMYVSAVSTTSITVTRGINGTTAAAHSGKAILVRRYPTDVEDATKIDAARTIREIQTGASGSAGNSEFGGYSFSAAYPKLRDTFRHYDMGVVA